MYSLWWCLTQRGLTLNVICSMHTAVLNKGCDLPGHILLTQHFHVSTEISLSIADWLFKSVLHKAPTSRYQRQPTHTTSFTCSLTFEWIKDKRWHAECWFSRYNPSWSTSVAILMASTQKTVGRCLLRLLYFKKQPMPTAPFYIKKKEKKKTLSVRHLIKNS